MYFNYDVNLVGNLQKSIIDFVFISKFTFISIVKNINCILIKIKMIINMKL